MKAMTSKEREAGKQPTPPEPYQHPKAIPGHVYMITRSPWGPKGAKYIAVLDNEIGQVRLYRRATGIGWSRKSTFGNSDDEWVDITDRVYRNTDELES